MSSQESWTTASTQSAAQHTSPNTTSSCGNCGAHVTPQFARVFGDNDDDVNACPNCTTYREMDAQAPHLDD